MEMADEHAAIVLWLARPENYSRRPDRVEHVETHISHVFLAGSYACKLKKPVKYDFLDFSTLGAREHACREEIRLNRRLAPDTYLDVVPVVRGDNGDLSLRGAGETVDWLVEMRRLPTELSLDTLHRRNELRPEHIDRLAATLVRFYKDLPPLRLTPEKHRQRYLSHIRGNLRSCWPRGTICRGEWLSACTAFSFSSWGCSPTSLTIASAPAALSMDTGTCGRSISA